ncbi:hypothetical protein BTM_4713 [Burkholderia thailandensis 34]|nr:hypothetical protein BTM_4713 [Burkholderia thailandensis 34]
MPSGSWVRARERAERRRATQAVPNAECERGSRRLFVRGRHAVLMRAHAPRRIARAFRSDGRAGTSTRRSHRQAHFASVGRNVSHHRGRSRSCAAARCSANDGRRLAHADACPPRIGSVSGVRAPIGATQCRRRRLLRGGACTPPLRTYDGPTNARGIRAHPPARLTAQATHSFNTGVSSDGARSASSNVRLLHVASSPLRPLSSGQRSKISATQSTNTRTFGDRCRLCG